MSIIIDIRSLLEPCWSGVSWYTYYLIDNLLKIDRENQYFLFYNQFRRNKLTKNRNKFRLLSRKLEKFNCYIVKLLKCFLNDNNQLDAALAKWTKYPNVKIIDCHYPNKILNLAMRFLQYPKIDQLVKKAINPGRVNKQAKENNNLTIKQFNNKTIFFAPNLNFIALTQTVKFILTIHDLSFIKFPEFFSTQTRLWHKLIIPKKLCQKAKQIIAVSQNTKDDLIEIYNLKSNKIKIIYSGIDKERFRIVSDREKLKEIRKKYSLPNQFILTVGKLEPRKNIESTLKAFELLHIGNNLANLQDTSIESLNLVIVGDLGFKYKEVLNLWRQSKFFARIKIREKIDHQDLPYVYNLAQVFLYLSFYEGFGLPPLEAMACGLPTIVSYAPVLPEIVADSALLVDPHNISETVFALKQILSDNNLRQSLIKKGLERVKQFNWQKTAEEVLEMVRQCRY